jgi:hypothetical protein
MFCSLTNLVIPTLKQLGRGDEVIE